MNKVIVFSLLLGFTTTVFADNYTPSHSCSKPYKPYEFKSERELNSFKSDVESYKNCINDFVEEQNHEANTHKEAANNAIEEWNSFVNYDLN